MSSTLGDKVLKPESLEEMMVHTRDTSRFGIPAVFGEREYSSSAELV